MSSGTAGDANRRLEFEELRPSLLRSWTSSCQGRPAPIQATVHDEAKMSEPSRTVVADLRRTEVVGIQPTQEAFSQLFARPPNGFVREVEVEQGVGEPEGLPEDRPRRLSAAKLVTSGLASDAGRIVRGKGQRLAGESGIPPRP